MTANSVLTQLPPEDWADELSSVNGQLIESLEELAAREDEQSDFQLQNVQGKLKDIAAKKLCYTVSTLQQKSMDQDLKHLNKKLEASREGEDGGQSCSIRSISCRVRS